MIRKLLVITILSISIIASAQTLKHPVIWTTDNERQELLQTIESYSWAQSIVMQLHQLVDTPLQAHQQKPSRILNRIPEFAANDHQNAEFHAAPYATAHNEILSLAKNAGILYYITQDQKYAQFAADILWAYIEEIAPRTPETTSICGFAFYDARTTYSTFALAYDLVHSFLIEKEAQVYCNKTNSYIPFDNALAQKALLNMVGNILQEYGRPDVHGRFVSNHPILTATGALYPILCIEDDAERERLFQVFWETGTAHQNSFKHTILAMFSDQGIWPESTSYSFMPIITQVLNIVDRIKPEMNVTSDYMNILEGNFIFDYLRYPNRSFVRFGDSKRYNDQTKSLYRYTLDLAKRRGYTMLHQKAELALSQTYATDGGYEPKITKNIFNNAEALQLFWGHDIPEISNSPINFNKPTVIIEHAGIALQRNAVQKDNIDYGLCGIIGGAHYVHSHATGIAMELYGANYVMAPNAGLPKSVRERRIPMHEHYFRLYAGNNTVVVNGTSHGLDEGSWKGNANVWQNTTMNIAAEPAHLEEPIAHNYSFATQFLDDKVNDCKQERTLSVIRTSATTAYYFDMFRSQSNGENNFHDYIYHNIGDKTRITSIDGRKMKTSATDRYQTDIGDVVHSPGWKFFEDTKTTMPTDESTKFCFEIKYDNRSMHMFIPAGVEREYTLALAPPTREARNGYIDKKTQVVAIRQQGEAWKRPYVAVLEPSVSMESSVRHVEQLVDSDKIVGAKVTSEVGEQTVDDYIICNDGDQIYENKALGLYFEGRFAVVRVIKLNGNQDVELYIGDGKQLTFGGRTLHAQDGNKGYLSITE